MTCEIELAVSVLTACLKYVILLTPCIGKVAEPPTRPVSDILNMRRCLAGMASAIGQATDKVLQWPVVQLQNLSSGGATR